VELLSVVLMFTPLVCPAMRCRAARASAQANHFAITMEVDAEIQSQPAQIAAKGAAQCTVVLTSGCCHQLLDLGDAPWHAASASSSMSSFPITAGRPAASAGSAEVDDQLLQQVIMSCMSPAGHLDSQSTSIRQAAACFASSRHPRVTGTC